MIEIHWLWLPFIIMGLSRFIAYIFEDGEVGPISLTAGIIIIISLIIYIIAGMVWLFTHIIITS